MPDTACFLSGFFIWLGVLGTTAGYGQVFLTAGIEAEIGALMTFFFANFGVFGTASAFAQQVADPGACLTEE